MNIVIICLNLVILACLVFIGASLSHIYNALKFITLYLEDLYLVGDDKDLIP